MELSCTEWVRRFSAHLLTLREMRLPTAADIAIERFDKANDLPPEEAAAAYVAMEERPEATATQ